MPDVMRTEPTRASERLKDMLRTTPFYAKGCFYAPGGTGKTYLLCTAPKPAFLLLTEPEISMPTIAKYIKDTGEEDLFIWDVTSWDDYMEGYMYLVNHLEDFNSVCLDGGTDINRKITRIILEEARKKKSTHDEDALDPGDWNRVMNRSEYAYKLYRDLPIHFFMSCLEAESKQDSMAIPMVNPKGLQNLLPSLFNLVGRLYAYDDGNGTDVRELELRALTSKTGKNPGGALPNIVQNPDLTAIVDLLKQEFQIKED